MTAILEAIVPAIVQGLTEFLPISSSGHLILAERAAGWKGVLMNSLTFDVALHAGTLTAVVGCLAICFLIRYLERHSLSVFVWYRLVPAGLVVSAWAVTSA